MFIDKAKIYVRSGNGGNGSASFRREKYVPLGGPDGGDGGKGGDIVLVSDPDMTTLLDFSYKRKYKADPGEGGSSSKSFGKDAEDLYIKVPMGTVVKEASTGKIMSDLSHKDDKIVVVKGGRGGRGNVRFKTATRQAPNFSEPGMPGEEREIILELKLLADVGLVGFPNVGKSTILSTVSNAKPKIANYHFTTLKPNLGVASIKGLEPFVIADIPGIIEGASEGVGLGLDFLRHIERTRVLIHVVDISGIEGRDPYEDFIRINEELKNYSVKLWDRPQIVAANKSDLVLESDNFEKFKEKVEKLGNYKIFKISAATGVGLKELMSEVSKTLATIPVTEMEIKREDLFIPEEKKFTYEIYREDNETFVVEGSFVDRLLSSVNVNEPDGLRYFYEVLKNKGVIDDLIEKGIKDGDMIRLNDFEFEFVI